MIKMLIFKKFYQILLLIGQLTVLFFLSLPFTFIAHNNQVILAQDGGFELPVQLIGFPVIILAVRTSNFVRKLAYAINPSTYRRSSARKIRGLNYISNDGVDIAKADAILLSHLGPNFCVYENVCLRHVQSAMTGTAEDWTEIINNYSRLPADRRQYYLLSVFIGNIIRSEELCQHFRETDRLC